MGCEGGALRILSLQRRELLNETPMGNNKRRTLAAYFSSMFDRYSRGEQETNLMLRKPCEPRLDAWVTNPEPRVKDTARRDRLPVVSPSLAEPSLAFAASPIRLRRSQFRSFWLCHVAGALRQRTLSCLSTFFSPRGTDQGKRGARRFSLISSTEGEKVRFELTRCCRSVDSYAVVDHHP